MNAIVNLLAAPLGAVMRFCYRLVPNYGGAILLFTLITRVILLPVSVWMHRYSIRLVRISPELLGIRAKYFGDADRIAEEESAMYKQNHYNPFMNFIPLLIQVLLLMGFIQVINHPMQYLFGFSDQLTAAITGAAAAETGLSVTDSAIQLAAVNLAQTSRSALEGIAGVEPAALAQALDTLAGFRMRFLGFDLSVIPALTGGWTLIAPLLAAVSAWLLCVVQNRANVLQAEQGRLNRIITMSLSVGLSLYLGYFVPAAVALYWIASNLLAIAVQYLLNAVIPPKKFIDYEALEENRRKLAVLEETKKKTQHDPALTRREKADIKRLNAVANKHLVFYSESGGFYKYYRGIVEALLEKSNVTIHYITSDPGDPIFRMAEENPRIRAYYVGDYRLISLMMRIEADVIVMTMPDLENYQIKRSYLKKDIEYIYVPHCIDSLNMTMRKGSMDHFDTVFCCGPHHKRELEQTRKAYGLPDQKLVEWGYSLLDDMRAAYGAEDHAVHAVPEILVAPSWQEENILESCIDPLLESLTRLDAHITVRPHPQTMKLNPGLAESIRGRWESAKVEIQTDFTSNSTVFDADLLITDWSGIAFEYAFTACKPILYIDTPMKVMNPDYQRIAEPPVNITLRERTGIRLKPEEASRAGEAAASLIAGQAEWRERISALIPEYLYNPGNSGAVGAAYIIRTLKEKQHRKS